MAITDEYKEVSLNTAQKWVRNFDSGKLEEMENGDRFRNREVKHQEIESRLVEYIKFRRKRVVHDKCG